MPMFGVLFREILDVLIYAQPGELADGALRVMIYFMAVGFGMAVLTFLQYELWAKYASYTAIAVRKEYFELLLKQEVAYFDETMSGFVLKKKK